MAFFFISLEGVLWLYNIRLLHGTLGLIVKILRYAILIYSVLITLSAQFLSTQRHESDQTSHALQAVDHQKDIDNYAQEISVLNKQIQTYIEQQRIFGTNSNRSDRAAAEARRDLLTSLQRQAIEKRDSQSERIIKALPLTVFDWMDQQLRDPGRSGSENLQLIFQLFGSVLLALMAPICLSMVNLYKERPVEAVTSLERAPELKDGLSDEDLKEIINMFYYLHHKAGAPVTALSAEAYFRSMHEKHETKLYTADQIRPIFRTIKRLQLEDLKKSVIFEELKNHYEKNREPDQQRSRATAFN